jgi:hypothetical protein
MVIENLENKFILAFLNFKFSFQAKFHQQGKGYNLVQLNIHK